MNNPNEYMVNYSYKQIENYANIQGWNDTGIFLARHHYTGNINIMPFLQSFARQELSHQKAKPMNRKQLNVQLNCTLNTRSVLSWLLINQVLTVF